MVAIPDLGSLGSSLTGPLQGFAKSAIWIVFGLIALIAAAVGYFYIDYTRRFNINCIVFSRRKEGLFMQIKEKPKELKGLKKHMKKIADKTYNKILPPMDAKGKIDLHQTRVLMDKGAYLKEKSGVWYFKIGNPLLSRKINIKMSPPDFKYILPIGKKNYMFFYRAGPDEFVPLDLKLTKTTMEFNILSGDKKLWAITAMQKYRDTLTKKDWKYLLQQYAPYVTFGIAAMLTIILIYVVLQKFDVLAGVAQSLEHTAKTLTETGVRLASDAPK